MQSLLLYMYMYISQTHPNQHIAPTHAYTQDSSQRMYLQEAAPLLQLDYPEPPVWESINRSDDKLTKRTSSSVYTANSETGMLIGVEHYNCLQPTNDLYFMSLMQMAVAMQHVPPLGNASGCGSVDAAY